MQKIAIKPLKKVTILILYPSINIGGVQSRCYSLKRLLKIIIMIVIMAD
jgi:hypothetical protein